MSLFGTIHLAPRMFHNLCDRQSLIYVAVQHRFDEIDGGVTHDPWDTKLTVHDLVDAVEWIFLVYERIKENAECPDILFFPTI